jgi:capsid protein
MAGFTTVADVIAETGGGRDLDEVLKQRRRELDEMEAADLSFDTSPENYVKPEPVPEPAPTPAPESDETASEPDAALIVALRR